MNERASGGGGGVNTVTFQINGEEITAEIDERSIPIKPFERNRGYVTTRDEDGREYQLLYDIIGHRYVAHPTS